MSNDDEPTQRTGNSRTSRGLELHRDQVSMVQYAVRSHSFYRLPFVFENDYYGASEAPGLLQDQLRLNDDQMLDYRDSLCETFLAKTNHWRKRALDKMEAIYLGM